MFLYSIECALNYAKIQRHHYMPSHYNNGVDEKEKLFIEHNIEMHVKVNDRVYKKLKIISNNVKRNHVNILYFSDDDGIFHYAWIKDFNRFMHDITLHNWKKYFCCKCLLFFTSEEKLKEHNDDFINCNTHNQPAKLILPDKENAFL